MILGGVYAATGAPGDTLWDSGEFIAAIKVWGIPHPPGTPLYVTLARVWTLAFGAVPIARAVGLFSAAATALAAAALALLVSRVTRSALMGFAAALCAGGMSTVWSSATEAEAYAAAMLLAMGLLLAAERAGATGDPRWQALTAYAIALAVPLHLSAMVAAPAAIVLASWRDGRLDRRAAITLAGVTIAASGVGRASAAITLLGAVMFLAAEFRWRRERRTGTLRAAAAVVIAVSACAILYFRAVHDPALNESDPRTWHAVWETIGRRQYGDFALWPRSAPLWLQFVQFLEYLDWQPALGLSPSAAPGVARTAVTIVFLALGAAGCRAHRALDRRSWLAFVVLSVSASVGLVLYLNFATGLTLGWGIVADGARHEVRERDYFFVLAFWTWGAWAGIGAVHLMHRGRRVGAALACAFAVLPLVTNFRAMDRSRGAEATAPAIMQRALLWGAPTGAVLVTAGDHDSFLLWYAQLVDGRRRDVTVAVWPLLYAPWYQRQLARRDGLDVGAAADPGAAIGRIVRAAGRPLAATLFVERATREGWGGRWMLRGLTFVPADSSAVWLGDDVPLVDTAAAAAFAREFGAPELPPDGAIDPAPRQLLEWLQCPAGYLARARHTGSPDSLASRCKFR